MSPRLRHLVAKVFGKVVLQRRLPERVGGAKLNVSPGAALAYFRSLDRPIWKDLYEFAMHGVQPGDTIWDVGANVGVFGFAAAHRAGPAGRVLAIEADPWLAALMRRSASRSRPTSAPVEVLCAAVTDRCDIQMFETPEWTRSGSHLSSSEGAGASLIGRSVEKQPVVTVTLDWLAQRLPPPAVIKLDVEGSEFAVLCGAENTLKQYRPKILLEVFDRSVDAVAKLLLRHRYSFYDMSDGWKDRKKIGKPIYQTLALPE